MGIVHVHVHAWQGQGNTMYYVVVCAVVTTKSSCRDTRLPTTKTQQETAAPPCTSLSLPVIRISMHHTTYVHALVVFAVFVACAD